MNHSPKISYNIFKNSHILSIITACKKRFLIIAMTNHTTIALFIILFWLTYWFTLTETCWVTPGHHSPPFPVRAARSWGTQRGDSWPPGYSAHHSLSWHRGKKTQTQHEKLQILGFNFFYYFHYKCKYIDTYTSWKNLILWFFFLLALIAILYIPPGDLFFFAGNFAGFLYQVNI